MDLTGKVAFVTGASRGIGREVALALARRGASVALVARDAPALGQLADAIGRDRSLPLAADLSDSSQLQPLISGTVERFGHLDVLVNNAGLAGEGDLLDSAPEALARLVDLNFGAVVLLTRLGAEVMARQRAGHIVNVASIAGVSGLPGAATYAGSKAAVRLFTASVRPELQPLGIRLTDVTLGFVKTDMLSSTEAAPRVRRLFQRVRQMRLMADLPAPAVAGEIVRAIEREQELLVMPAQARYLLLPFPGIAGAVTRLLASR